jgi:ATP-binding cassette, subfamily C, bacterial CydCD
MRLDRGLLADPVARRGLVAVALCSVLQSVAIVAAAALLAQVISAVFLHHASLRAVQVPLVVFGLCVLLRAVLIWLAEGIGHRTAALLVSELRSRSLRRLVLRGPIALAGERTGEVAGLLTSGLDALDPYFARFLPQLVAAVAIPLAAIAYVASVDWVSAVILLVTVPLILAFMVVIGWTAERSTRRRWRTFQVLGGHFLDVLQGLPTLRLHGRGPAQAERIGDMSRRLRRATMETLRVAFLSSFALELLASLGTALLAVTIAIRLVDGTLDLRSGLTVLILAPEVYLPLRALGAAFHGCMDGVEAARRLDAMCAGVAEVPASTSVPARAIARCDIAFEHVWFAHQGRADTVSDLTTTIAAGERVLVCGHSGAGKTTLLALVLGLVHASRGTVSIGGVEVASLGADARGDLVAWLPQSPHMFGGSIADNIRLGAPDAGDAEVRRALRDVDAAFTATLPGGINAVVGDRGMTLSGGERQRIALARTLLHRAPILLLDEPLAHLDAASRRTASTAIEERTRGRTVVVAAHGAADFPWVDRIITLDDEQAGSAVPAMVALEAMPA